LINRKMQENLLADSTPEKYCNLIKKLTLPYRDPWTGEGTVT